MSILQQQLPTIVVDLQAEARGQLYSRHSVLLYSLLFLLGHPQHLPASMAVLLFPCYRSSQRSLKHLLMYRFDPPLSFLHSQPQS